MSGQIPAQAGRGQVANARFGGGFPPGVAGGRVLQQQCAFPAPPPRRTYCSPAIWSSTDGRNYAPMLVAYGQSRPASN